MEKFYPTYSILILFALLQNFCSSAQVAGCRDPQANNYNASATTNDGSCTYNQTSYTPPVKVNPMNSLLQETSGLQWAGNALWSFNDGGGAAAIYKIDTTSNTIFQTVNLEGATNVDWEDIAFDGAYFYIGDFGNNLNGARTDLKIYKFPIALIPDHSTNSVVTIPSSAIEVINFTYADQPQPPIATASNSTKFDCEAMIADDGKLHLFTKNWVDNNSTHYVINSTSAGNHSAINVETLSTGYLVTGADKAVGEAVITLLGYQNAGFGEHYLHILSDYSAGLYFNGNKRRIDLPAATDMGQAEGITFRNGTYGYISNEKFERTSGSFTLTVNQKLRSFNTSSFVSQYILPIQLQQFGVGNVNGVHQLNWKFDSEVKNLEVQHSTNGSNFTTLTRLQNSKADRFYNKPDQRNNYYRLAWEQTNGGTNYSKTLFASNDEKSALSNFNLKENGLFAFRNNYQEAINLSFKLLSPEGKLIAQIPTRTYQQGYHSIAFSTTPIVGVACILAINSEGSTSKIVLAQK